MESTGLISRVLAQQERNFKTHQLLQNSKEAINHNDGLKESLKLLKEVKASKNILLALGAEELLLRQELALYANSPEETNSIKKGIEQLQEARKSLVVVQDAESYKSVAETYSSKRKEAGLPLDSFREFLKSHSTRLTNRMASPLSVPEKNILRQRKENLSMVREVYITMQQEALGIKAPSKGLER